MTRSAKKNSEILILRKVFNELDYPNVYPSEKPDFIIGTVAFFGVEVTEFYVDQTGARLHNRPNYANDVIDGIYIDKDDIGKIESVKIEVMNKHGKWRELPGGSMAVRQENLDVTIRVGLLIAKINEKSNLYSQYNQTIGSIDLVVCDARSSLFDGINDSFVRHAITNIYRSKLLHSRFRNIYLVIPVEMGKKHEVFFLK